MMGIARIVCAITIAAGVKSSEREPSGPERERIRYRTSPTTTGGKPKNALIRTTSSRRPRKGKIAMAVPIGKLTVAATTVAARLTLIESPTISRKSCNPVAILQKGNFSVGRTTRPVQQIAEKGQTGSARPTVEAAHCP
jgi:hypothetical protein